MQCMTSPENRGLNINRKEDPRSRPIAELNEQGMMMIAWQWWLLRTAGTLLGSKESRYNGLVTAASFLGTASRAFPSSQGLPSTSSFRGRRQSSQGDSFLSPRGTVHHQAQDDHEPHVLTDWLVQNLEGPQDTITRASAVQAGEGDTLPSKGLAVGPFLIVPAEASVVLGTEEDLHSSSSPTLRRLLIRLLVGRNGWGTGVHPTTRLCLEWIAQHVMPGHVLLDYGCGSGILSVAALHRGAARCIGVDVEAEALVTAQRNMRLNGYRCAGDDDDEQEEELQDQDTDHPPLAPRHPPAQFEAWHVREVLPYSFTGVQVCVANILIGQLVRPSMVAALVSNLEPGGWLCLSGIRPSEVEALQAAYGDQIDWSDAQYAELSALDTPGSLDSYGYDCGRWARVVGRKQSGASSRAAWIEALSDAAVS